ncbi:uncharacterized protein LOC132648262 [Meriones unguiculatus]|uniref:uncharacterized protein LOC132648262 n=1 Tax=Meriones unguiculatus TaxID=10047 RepID=UPI00293F22CC|nr:uncharacterized protein LOC132648262 [Meriones unguiculatus]
MYLREKAPRAPRLDVPPLPRVQSSGDTRKRTEVAIPHPTSARPPTPTLPGAAGGGAAAGGDRLLRGEEPGPGLAGTLWRLAAEGASAAVLRFLPAVSRPVSAVSSPPPRLRLPRCGGGGVFAAARYLLRRSLGDCVPATHPVAALWGHGVTTPSTRDPRRPTRLLGMRSTGWTAERRGREGWPTCSVTGHGSCGAPFPAAALWTYRGGAPSFQISGSSRHPREDAGHRFARYQAPEPSWATASALPSR